MPIQLLEKNVDDRHAEKIAAALSTISLDKYKDSDSLDKAGIAWTSAYHKLTDLWADESDTVVAESLEPPVG